MNLNLLDYLLIGISASLLLVIIIFRIIWKLRKKPLTRERFAFFGVTILSSLFIFIVPYLLGDNVLLEIANAFTKFFFHISIDISKPSFSDKILFLLTITFFGWIILRIFNNWNGVKSLRQFELEIRNERTTIISEVIAFFKENEKLLEYKPTKDETINFRLQETTIDKIAWHVQVHDLLTLSSKQYKINIDKDWFQKESCYLSTYGNYPIAILCSLKDVSESKIKGFIGFVQSNLPKRQNVKIKFLVAIKSGSFSNYSKIINEVEVNYTNENQLLDELVDFSDYYNFLINQFEKKEIIEGYPVKLSDVYTEPSCRIKSRNKINSLEIEIDNIESYIFEWLNESKNKKHLAILGEYGQGKSVLSQRIAYLIAKNQVTNRTPIIVELRGRFPKQYNNTLALLSDWSANFSINPKALLKLHLAGKLLIIFEGFDEMELVGDYEIRLEHFKRLWGFSTPNSKLIITGRPNFFLNDRELTTLLRTQSEFLNLPYCEEIYINRFNLSQIENALRNCDPDTKNDIMSILEDQGKNNSFYDLLSRPSSLFITSIMWKERNISNYKSKINSAFVIEEFLNHSYSRQATKNVKSPLSIYERAYFMQGIALGAVMKNSYSNQISQNDLKEIVLKLYNNFPEEITKQHIGDDNYSKKVQQRFDKRYNEESVLTDIRSCGILVRDLSTFDSFKFSHKSFLELLVSNYFVSVILYKDNRESLLNKVIINSISNALEIRINTISRSSDVLRFIAELFASRIQFPIDTKERDKLRIVFNKLCHFKYIGMETTFKLIQYTGYDIGKGVFVISVGVILTLSLVASFFRSVFFNARASTLELILNIVILIPTLILPWYFIHQFIKGGNLNYVIEKLLMNITLSERKFSGRNSEEYLPIINDKGNLLLFYLVCKELEIDQNLIGRIPQKVHSELRRQTRNVYYNLNHR